MATSLGEWKLWIQTCWNQLEKHWPYVIARSCGSVGKERHTHIHTHTFIYVRKPQLVTFTLFLQNNMLFEKCLYSITKKRCQHSRNGSFIVNRIAYRYHNSAIIRPWKYLLFSQCHLSGNSLWCWNAECLPCAENSTVLFRCKEVGCLPSLAAYVLFWC